MPNINFLFYLKLYFLTTLVFLGIDAVWLTIISKNFYAKHLGYLMSATPNLGVALLFYLINVVGIVVLVVLPNLQGNNLGKVALLGALYGLVTYATYDLTNLATIKNWPVIVTIVDLIWGISLSVAVSCLSFIIAKKIM